MDWYCFKCQEKVIEAQIWLTYMEITQPLRGMKCPKCGDAYFTEETVIERINKAEEMLEGK